MKPIVENDTFLERTLRFIRSALAGGVATIADLMTLTALVELAHLSPSAANVPALIVGALTQFVGCRTVVFRASGEKLGPQARGFFLVELGTLALNALAFQALISWTRIPYALARPLGTFLVYVAFSYPMWTRVFRVRATEGQAPASASAGSLPA